MLVSSISYINRVNDVDMVQNAKKTNYTNNGFGQTQTPIIYKQTNKDSFITKLARSIKNLFDKKDSNIESSRFTTIA